MNEEFLLIVRVTLNDCLNIKSITLLFHMVNQTLILTPFQNACRSFTICTIHIAYMTVFFN